MSNNITIKLDGDKLHGTAFQQHNGINKVIGTVNANNFAKLISAAGLTANPRKSKVGKITRAISDTLINYPEMLVFRTKGLLISTIECKSLDRNRFNLSFDDPSYEGVLDGGHNMLAIGLHFLNESGESADKIRKVKKWDDFIELWNEQDLDDLYELLNTDLTLSSICIPIEIVSSSGEMTELEFKDIVYEISDARNNNVSLVDEAMDYHKGYYEILEKSLDHTVNAKVEWKPGDKDKTINSKDIVAMGLIPLIALQREGKLSDSSKINPVNIYSSKGKCVDHLGEIIEKERKKNGNHDITDPLLISAFGMLGDLPKIYEYLYNQFPEAYNKTSPGFGRQSCVRMYDKDHKANKDTYLRNAPKTKYFSKECVYKYPDGFIMPIFASLSTMMEVKNNKLVWKVEPFQHIADNLNSWVSAYYHSFITTFKHDPQKCGKTSGVYMTMEVHILNSIK